MDDGQCAAADGIVEERKNRILWGFYGGLSGSASGRLLSKGDLWYNVVRHYTGPERSGVAISPGGGPCPEDMVE